MLLNVWLNVVAQTTSQEVQSVEITQSPVSQLVTEQVAVTVSEQVASTVQVTVSEQVSVTSLQIAETAVLNATETQSNTTAIDTNGTITADATITQNTIVQNTIIYNSYSPTFDAMWQTERKPEETVTGNYSLWQFQLQNSGSHGSIAFFTAIFAALILQ